MTKHTPGPWSVPNVARCYQSLQAGGIPVYAHSARYGERVALLNLHHNESFDHSTTETARTVADARLIAAAPEMLAANRLADKALDAALVTFKGRVSLAEIKALEAAQAVIRAAIAKAEGAQ